jgi:hypothetical protein
VLPRSHYPTFPLPRADMMALIHMIAPLLQALP